MYRSIHELRAAIKDVFSNDGIGEAIKQLKNLVHPEGKAYNAILQMEQDLRDANLLKVSGAMDQRALDVKYAELGDRFLTLLDTLQPSDLEPPKPGQKSKQGSLLYQIPTEMEVQKETRCRVRLAYDTSALLENITLTDDTRIKEVRISEVMQVELVDPSESAFLIRGFSDTEQFVEKDDYTEWLFFVKPLRQGSFPLMLRISVIEKIGDKERAKNIVLEETVVIVADLDDAPEADFKPSGITVEGSAQVPAPKRPAARTARPLKRASATALALAALMTVSGIAYAALPSVRMNVDWTLVNVRNTREAYQEFAEKYEGQPKAAQALVKVETLDWQETLQQNSTDAVERFIEEHPDSRFENRATELLETLYFEKAVSETSPVKADSALKAFLKRFPDGKLKEKVEEKLQPSKTTATTAPVEPTPTKTDFPPAPPRKEPLLPEKRAQKEARPPVQRDAPAQETKRPSPQPTEESAKPAAEPSKPAVEPTPAKTDLPPAPATTSDASLRQYNMVRVRGGTFTMGCTSEQGSDCYDSEKPAHQVTVSDFYIGKYEVTQKEWREVMGSDPPELAFKGCDACPVERVSWNDIQQFISKLNAKTGMTYRLPTEAEWEYAARGGSQSRGYKYAGSNSLDEVAWYTSNSGSKTHPVGQKKANELGLYDMSGNVWEWCADDWHGSYSGAPSTGRAWIDSPRASARVGRGGGWDNGAQYCRVSDRSGNTPSGRSGYLGFRLAL